MNKKGLFFAILSAVLYGIVPLITKLVYSSGMNSICLSFCRYALNIPLLFILCKSRGVKISTNKNDLKTIILIGCLGTSMTTILLSSSYNFISIGTASTLHFLQPLFVTLFCVLFYDYKLSRQQTISLIMAMSGIVLTINLKDLNSLTGVALAVGSSVVYAFYIVGSDKKISKKADPLCTTFWLSVVSTCFCLLVTLLTRKLVIPSQPLAIFGILMVAVVSMLALLFLQYGIKLLGAADASLFCLFEPLTSTLVGYLFLNEVVGYRTFIADSLILLAVFLLIFNNRKKQTR